MTRIDRDSEIVFILGNMRSGTTILYKVLASLGPFCYPTPFHLAHFRDYERNGGFDRSEALARMERRFEEQNIVHRFIDSIQVGPLTPEEYGFAVWRGQISPGTLEAFTRFFTFVAADAEPGQRLLLKNPRDIANARFIHRSFPKAKFIFIHRHPGPTIESRIRELRTLFHDGSPYQEAIEPQFRYIMNHRLFRDGVRLGLRPDNAVALFFLLEFHRNSSRFLRNLQHLPRSSYFSTTYEDLCADPAGVVGGILRFLGLGDHDASRARKMIRASSRPKNDIPILRSAFANRLLRRFLRHYGYDGLWPAEQARRVRDSVADGPTR